jgi:hypothetical protein
MALTITREAGQNLSYTLQSNLARGLKMEFGKFTPDNSWLAAGEEMTFSFNTPVLVVVENKGGIVFEYDYTNEKMLAYYADYSTTTDGALIVVPDTTDLSTICANTRYVAYGFV